MFTLIRGRRRSVLRLPKPRGRAGRAGALRFLWLLRRDILSAQSPRLYGAKMAEFRAGRFRSFLINDPALLRLVLKDRPADFPKSPHIVAGLSPLLGRGLLLAEGEDWQRLNALLAPLMETGPGQALPQMHGAGRAALSRLAAAAPGQPLALEPHCRRATADVILRLVFGRPIEPDEADELLRLFDAYEASAPLISLRGVVDGLRGRAGAPGPGTVAAGRDVRAMVARLVARHRSDPGSAGDALVSRLFAAQGDSSCAAGPEAGTEMVDQITTLLLAGHETSAAALAWSLYMMALHPAEQAAVAAEAAAVLGSDPPDRAALARLELARDAVRETLRLYPPVPMLMRQAARPERFRDRAVPAGAQIVISPWHLHRHAAHWPEPDAFRPARWRAAAGAPARREAYLPFSAGPRACPGAGLAMAETTLLLAMICRAWELRPAGSQPRPMSRLTLRAAPGLFVTAHPRQGPGGAAPHPPLTAPA